LATFAPHQLILGQSLRVSIHQEELGDPTYQLKSRFTLQWAGIKADEKALCQIPFGDSRLIPYIHDPADMSVDDFTLSHLTTQMP
tara:strand:+ start:1005 stop:1259 length:255 start_codon:yes stop_codon:yes gene_type:complete